MDHIFFSANYFMDCISEQDLDEMNIEIIRNTLYKVGLSMASISKRNLQYPYNHCMSVSSIAHI